MPIYTYRCSNCDHEFDEKQGFGDPSLTLCPNCEEEALHRVYKPVGVVFKGSGFYATDNRSPSGLNGKPKSHESETSSDDSSEKSSKKDSGESKSKASKSPESKVAETA